MKSREQISISFDYQKALDDFTCITVEKAKDIELYDNAPVPGNGFCSYGIQETNGGKYAYKL